MYLNKHTLDGRNSMYIQLLLLAYSYYFTTLLTVIEMCGLKCIIHIYIYIYIYKAKCLKCVFNCCIDNIIFGSETDY